MLIGADQIRALVPHSGKMCLLERVLDWDEQSIRCETSSHLDMDNPLRRDGRLSSICGIEYAAQAMALHAALCSNAGAPARHGYLASVRDANCTTAVLDGHDSPLLVSSDTTLRFLSVANWYWQTAQAPSMHSRSRATVRL